MKQEMMGWQWYQLDHMQTICTSLQTDNHANTSSPQNMHPANNNEKTSRVGAVDGQTHLAAWWFLVSSVSCVQRSTNLEPSR